MSTSPRLHVVADLDLEVGGVRARLEGAGDELTFTADRPLALWRELRAGDHGGLVGALGELVQDTGVTVAVRGPFGQLATAGAVDSRMGRALFGTSAVRPAGLPLAVAAAALVGVGLLGRMLLRHR